MRLKRAFIAILGPALAWAALAPPVSAQTLGDGVNTLFYQDPDSWLKLSNGSDTYNGQDAFDEALFAGLPPIERRPDHNLLLHRASSMAEKYRADWGELPQDKVAFVPGLAPGSDNEVLRAWRRRLGLSEGTVYDADLGDRIHEYRRAHGLPEGNSIDLELERSLNLGFAHYNAKIALNLERLRELPLDLGERFVLVDIVRQQLSMYEDDTRVGGMKVVVGKPEQPTPIMAARITYSVVNPYWNVPVDLVRDRYAARVIRGGPSYMKRQGFEALSGWEDDAIVLQYSDVNWRDVASGKQDLRFRQRPGPYNGMGEIKIMFPNSFGVYLHDTPSRDLFAADVRMFSAGCVRLENAWELASWLHGERPVAEGSAAEQDVWLEESVPVYLVYLTAVPTAYGFDFAPDIYNRDEGTSSFRIDPTRVGP